MKLKQLLFILFSLFTLHFSLQAREPLPILVEGGEPFTHREDYYIPERSSVYAVAFSPDGKTVLSGSGNNIELWDISTGKLIKSFKGDKMMEHYFTKKIKIVQL